MRPHDDHAYPPGDLEERRTARLSKFLSLVLRHRAPQFGLDLDDEGFVSVEGLLEVIHEQDGMDWVTVEEFDRVMGNHVRRRFEIRDGRIRATYGHSFHKPIRFDPIDPPDELYIGMAKARTNAARANGIRPEGRQYVHLTDDREEAMKVGGRRADEAEVVTVRAKEASDAGIAFYKPTEGLFLSESIPSSYLDVAVEFGRKARRGRGRRR